MEDTRLQSGLQASDVMSGELSQVLLEFVWPLLVALDEQIDKRLVRAFFKTLSKLLCSPDALGSHVGETRTSQRIP
jgi:hypothetical protein